MYCYSLGIKFLEVVEKYGTRTSVWFNENMQLSYSELNTAANRMAHLILAHNVRCGNVVALAGNKSLPALTAMLACLKIGAPYVMLDPDSPIERQGKIVARCQPRLILGETEFIKSYSSISQKHGMVTLDTTTESFRTQLAELPACQPSELFKVTGSTPAYIMFTSGSTGLPKGAVMTHANVLNLIAWAEDTFGISYSDILTNVNPFYFDNSVFDFYAALFSGACLVPFDKEEVRDPRRLVDKISASNCSVWFSVPSLLIFLQVMKATNGKNLGSIKTFIFGGEGYPKAKLKQLYNAYKGNSRFFNVYGPTECTCICSAYRISDNDFDVLDGFVPLGTLAENFDCLILDENDNPAPGGSIGELCLLGPNVGLGYYNDPERTALSFIQNPYNRSYREIMYRTGDLVRLDVNDGKLYILGRKDNQIKHMGYRIELEEIEAALHCLEYIDEAAVIHRTVGGLSRLIAVVALRGEQNDNQIRQDLKKFIPDYMIPSEFPREKRLPKNPNGKVDRRVLKEQFANR